MPTDELPSAKLPFTVPQMSHDELFAFHQHHFSNEAIADFGQRYMNPAAVHESHAGQQQYEWEEDKDDLGYYDDGVKRTLTDEQIEIFRHSELRELDRQQEKQAQAKANLPSDVSADDVKKLPLMQTSGLASSFEGRKKKKKKSSKNLRQEPKPDLRKRTWDVVEAGLDSLDYD